MSYHDKRKNIVSSGLPEEVSRLQSIVKTVLDYEFECDKWERVADMTMMRDCFSVAVGNGKLFAVGGLDTKIVECLDLKNAGAEWKRVARTTVTRRSLGVAVGDGKLFAVGGITLKKDIERRVGRKIFLNTVEYLDLKNLGAGWKRVADMTVKRHCHGVAVGDGKLFAVGGYDGSNGLNSVEYLDLKNLGAGWKRVADMTVKRHCHGVAVGDGKLFAVGGNGGIAGKNVECLQIRY